MSKDKFKGISQRHQVGNAAEKGRVALYDVLCNDFLSNRKVSNRKDITPPPPPPPPRKFLLSYLERILNRLKSACSVKIKYEGRISIDILSLIFFAGNLFNRMRAVCRAIADGCRVDEAPAARINNRRCSIKSFKRALCNKRELLSALPPARITVSYMGCPVNKYQ